MREPTAPPHQHRPAVSGCPCCLTDTPPEVFYRVSQIPIQSCVLLNTVDEARSYPVRDLELAHCRQCGFIFNHIFDSGIVEYAAVTEESQHYSGTFSRFAKSLAREIASTYPLDQKHVLEIGCGKGDFLIELCSLADCTGLGIDPGFSQERLAKTEFAAGYDATRIKFISDYFRSPHPDLKADLIMCRHTLEHIPDVRNFVASIRDSIGTATGVGVFFETPDADRVLAEGAFWDIYYEHCSYFTCGTHASLFKRSGFEIDSIRLDYADQYIIQYAHPTAKSSADSAATDEARISELVHSFPDKVSGVQNHWQGYIREKSAAGKTLVTWGGGSKSVAFLTTLGIGDAVRNVVDINPFKQGKYLPGTGHKVISPDELRKVRPDIVIVMNPIYIDEIAATLQALELSCEIVAV